MKKLIIKIKKYISRKINIFFETYVFYKVKSKELNDKINTNKSTIWFIGAAHYDNIGDLAISESTTVFLNDYKNKYNIIEIRLCDYYKYIKAIKKHIKRSDIIILQGGGNMCFSYFDAEYNRRSVIAKFPNNKVIIFPVTIDYEENNRARFELNKTKKIYSKHDNLIICAREKKSYKIIKDNFSNNEVILIPDIVLYNDYKKYNLKRKGICLCLRKDIEKSNLSENVFKYFADKNCQYTDNVSDIKKVEIDERKKIVEDKMKEYASYELVITDRLHTMIFCYITKTPCLFLDNLNGKVLRVYNDWIKDSSCNYIKKLDINNIENQIKEFINIKPDNKAENIIKKCFEKLKECMED